MLSAIPRKYRTLVIRIAVCLIFCVLLFHLLPGREQAIKGAGRSDESGFRFVDYDENVDESLDDVKDVPEPSDDGIIHERALAPAAHRAVDGSDLIQKSENITEEEVVPEDQFSYYDESEMEPWFKKPTPDQTDPGEFGNAYRLSEEEEADEKVKESVKKGWSNHAFNHYICEKISLHRALPDRRDKECKVNKKGEKRQWRKPLPDTSVIIIFHNEAWCALLRTVYSVLETSPARLLKEIILVDDASTNEDLGKKLDDYVSKLKIVRIIRLPKRSGLIRARLVGAESATAEVLTFLDSHCECAPYWLEPLLEGIAEDPKRVVCPVIEVIDADNFAVSTTTARHIPIGAFGWGLEFRWATQPGNRGMEISENDRDAPFTTPVMAGACFSFDKANFKHYGSYDLSMNGIGSENIELSFRVWMCGGSIEINPCSRVGHVGRKRKPYKDTDVDDRQVKNKMVIAETWMDDYKWMFYRRTPRARELETPDVTSRRKKIEEMDCGNFEWYMTNVAPDTHIVAYKDIISHGEIRPASDESYCLDSNNVHGNPGSILDLMKCHSLGKGQYFEFTKETELRQNTISELCLAASTDKEEGEIWTEKCRFPWHDTPESQKWLLLPEGRIYHLDSDRCLTFNLRTLSVSLLKCVKGPGQTWVFDQKDGYEEEIDEDEEEDLEALGVEELPEEKEDPSSQD